MLELKIVKLHFPNFSYLFSMVVLHSTDVIDILVPVYLNMIFCIDVVKLVNVSLRVGLLTSFIHSFEGNVSIILFRQTNKTIFFLR